MIRVLGWGVLGMAFLIERLILFHLLDGDFFLRQTRLQCSSNSAGKLVKFASAFAVAVDIRVVIHNLGFVGSET